MKYSTLGFTAAMCVALAACSEGTGPRTMLTTQIDRAVLDSAGSLNVSFTITNVGTQPEDVSACGGQPGPRVQRQQGNRWEELLAGSVGIYSMVPVSLQPGASIVAVLMSSRWARVYRLVISYQLDDHRAQYQSNSRSTSSGQRA